MTRFRQGTYIVKNKEKYIGKSAPYYRSSWELKFCEMCDNHPNIVAWASEPIAIKYPHPFKRTMSNYIPDFFVVYVTAKGKRMSELIEIKPYSQTNPKYAKSEYDKEQLAINSAKWKAALQYCAKQGIRFKVITEKNIFKNTKYSNNIKKPGRRKK